MTPEERREHVLELADALRANILVDDELLCLRMACEGDDPHGMVWKQRPFDGAPLMTVVMLTHDPGATTLTYLVALHELGHLARWRGRLLDTEAAAWEWAIQQSREGLTAGDWGGVLSRLTTYTGCRRCKPSDDFNRLLAQAERNADVRNTD